MGPAVMIFFKFSPYVRYSMLCRDTCQPEELGCNSAKISAQLVTKNDLLDLATIDLYDQFIEFLVSFLNQCEPAKVCN